MGSERAEALAERFGAANRAVRVAIAAATDERLRTTCPAERCTTVALACHVANGHEVVSGWVRTLVAGHALPPVTMDVVDRANAEGFARDAGCTRDEVLERLARNGEAVAETVRGLTDAELDLTAPFALFGGASVSAQTLIEQILIGDPLAHLPSIRAASGEATDDERERREAVPPTIQARTEAADPTRP